MAEQALNTIYLLGEQPDVLCTKIVQKLHTRVFDRPHNKEDDEMSDIQVENDADTEQQPAQSEPKPEASGKEKDSSSKVGAIHLAQLVFVVGHVAIKHIVYLELVEREVKRQKDESSKGE
jgi:condensin complex subunit 1